MRRTYSLLRLLTSCCLFIKNILFGISLFQFLFDKCSIVEDSLLLILFFINFISMIYSFPLLVYIFTASFHWRLTVAYILNFAVNVSEFKVEYYS